MRLLLAITLLTISLYANAQAVANVGGGMTYLYKNEASEKNYNKVGSYTRNHKLGDNITTLMDKFESEYVYYEESGGAYSVEEKKFIKPNIYLAVQRLDKYYVKAVRKDKISQEEANAIMAKVLSLAIKLKNYQTSEVEIDLEGEKDEEKITEYFMNIKFRE
jgi:hypothetical protein